MIWLIVLFAELNWKLTLPVKLFCDSKAAIQIAVNPIYHERTKHIEIDCHFIREKIQKGIIQTKHVRTDHQLADILKKALGTHNMIFYYPSLEYSTCFIRLSLRGG